MPVRCPLGPDGGDGMRRFLKNNGLSLVNIALFLAALFVMSVTGHHQYNGDLRDHHDRPVGYWSYLHTGDFIEGVFENWESEFLQMGTYVLFTAFLFQKRSPESKPLGEQTPQDVDPRRQRYPDPPRPVRRGGVILKLYMNSLAIALLAMFVLSFVLHAIGGTCAYNEEQLAHGGHPVSILGFLTTSNFWFQSLQNWQIEFLAVASLAILAIWLRQQGSPESKPVAAPHSHTGS
jgi:Domain of unknown function (DUF6766)